MEKMVYERPVMRAETFAANNYVAACSDNPNAKHKYYAAIVGDKLFKFFGDPTYHGLDYKYWTVEDEETKKTYYLTNQTFVDMGFSLYEEEKGAGLDITVDDHVAYEGQNMIVKSKTQSF